MTGRHLTRKLRRALKSGIRMCTALVLSMVIAGLSLQVYQPFAMTAMAEEATPSEATPVTPKPSSSQSTVQPEPSAEQTPAPEKTDLTTTQPEQTSSPKPQTTPPPDMTTAQPEDAQTAEPAPSDSKGTDTPIPTGTDTPAPEGTETLMPEGTETPAPEGTETPAPEGTETPAPEGTETPAPEGTETPAPEGTETPAPEGTETPAPEGTETPAPEGTETPAPEGTETPAPEGTETPAPEGTEIPEPAVTETPVPTGIPASGEGLTFSASAPAAALPADLTAVKLAAPAPAPAAATLAAVPAAEGDPVGAKDTPDEEYAIPEGSAYIFEIGQIKVYENDAESNAIQKGLEGALDYVKSLDPASDRTATIVVSKGTFEGGIDMDASTNETINGLIAGILGLPGYDGAGGSLTIRIVSEDAIVTNDAGTEITEITSDSAGDTQVEGNIAIDAGELDLNIVLAGLYLSTRGTVNVQNAESVTYTGTKKDDHVTIKAGDIKDSVTVSAGDGDDVVDVTVQAEPNVTGDTIISDYAEDVFGMVGDMENPTIVGGVIDTATITSVSEVAWDLKQDAQDADSDAPLEVTVDTGDGDDIVSVDVTDGTDIETETFQMTETANGTPINVVNYEVQVDTRGSRVDVRSGKGNDRVTIGSSRSGDHQLPIVGAAVDLVYGKVSNPPKAEFVVDAGEDDDVIIVDGSTAFATYGSISVDVQGGSGFDRLHLTGRLDTDVSAPDRITASASAEGTEITIHAMDAADTIDIEDLLFGELKGVFSVKTGKSVEALTDSLQNKQTVKLEASSSNGQTAQPIKAQSFTNYGIIDRAIRCRFPFIL